MVLKALKTKSRKRHLKVELTILLFQLRSCPETARNNDHWSDKIDLRECFVENDLFFGSFADMSRLLENKRWERLEHFPRGCGRVCEGRSNYTQQYRKLIFLSGMGPRIADRTKLLILWITLMIQSVLLPAENDEKSSECLVEVFGSVVQILSFGLFSKTKSGHLNSPLFSTSFSRDNVRTDISRVVWLLSSRYRSS